MLQNLSKKELEELLEYLKTYKLDYKNKINLPENITFGIEIEGVGDWFCNFEDEIEKLNKKYHSTSNQETSLPYFENCEYELVDGSFWSLKDEISLYEMGDEVSSPVFNNNPKSWQAIKEMCDLLKSRGIYITDKCAGHIHYGAQNLIDNNPEKLLNILKMWAAYESLFYKFGAGEFKKFRDSVLVYAKPVAKEIKKFLENNQDNERDYSFLVKYFGERQKHKGINLQNLYIADSLRRLPTINTIDTVEVRVPNGTLNPKIWQNNVRLFGNLFAHAVSADFDKEKITSLIRELPFKNYNENNLDDYISYVTSNLPLALDLADTIFTDENDKYSFLAQYLYGVNEPKEEKVKTLANH